MLQVGQVINTTSGFKVEVVDTYTCYRCGSEVRVVQAFVPMLGGEVTIDRCLNCDAKNLAAEAAEEARRAAVRNAKALFDQESLINDSLRAATFENYFPMNESQREAKLEAWRYAENFTLDKPNNLIFSGPYGIGKSHLAVAIAKRLTERGFSSVFISVPRLFTKVKSTFGRKDGPTEEDIIEALGRVDLLVLDDIGAEYIEVDRSGEGRGWGVSKIFEIVDVRAGKSTVYTTNLSSDEMKKRFGMRNFSRLMENTQAVKMDGEDFRLRAFKGGRG